MREFIKKILPESIKKSYNSYEHNRLLSQKKKLPLLNENDFEALIVDIFNINDGDTLFIHSSVNQLNLSFPSYKVLEILLRLVGSEGTIVLPTYPKLNSFKFLSEHNIFDIKKTPTFTGLLNEFARRHKDSIRSMHPTKSVVAIGKHAKFLTKDHHKNIYPYSGFSPYYKINSLNTKIIGIGVKTTYLSAVHSVEDTHVDEFPVDPYHEMIFESKCIDYDGNLVYVKTKAHDMKKMNFDLPKFFRKHVDPDICKDINFGGMNFFLANANDLYNLLCNLANNGITIYSKRYYR